jgi:hypothetical protein
MTEEQIDRLGLLPKGEYEFRVIESEDTISQKSGKPQIKAKLRVKDSDGNPRTITAYLGTNGQFMLRQLRHFCRSTGLMKEYEARKICADTIFGSEGIVSLDIGEGGISENGILYPDKNIIVDFIGDKEPAKVVNKLDELNDDIPF